MELDSPWSITRIVNTRPSSATLLNRKIPMRYFVLMVLSLTFVFPFSAGAQDKKKEKSAENKWVGQKIVPKPGKKIQGVMVEYSMEEMMTPIYVYEVKKNKLLVRGIEQKGWIYKKNVLKLDEAVASYEKAVKEKPKSAEAWAQLAHVRAYAEKDFDQALKDCEHALELDDQLVRGYKIRGNIHIRQGDSDEALEAYEKTIELDKKYAPGYNNIGAVLMKQGEHQKAIRYFEQAIKLADKAIYLRNIGTVYIAQGEYEKAEEFLLKAVKKNPSSDACRYALAYTYLEKSNSSDEDVKAAIKHLEEACKLSFWKNRAFLTALSVAYVRNGDDEKADEIQDKIDELKEDSRKFQF